MKPLVDCNTHDYFEIACMYRYDIRIVMDDKTAVEGKALDLKAESGREWILVQTESSTQMIELNQVKTVDILSPHARFDKIAC